MAETLAYVYSSEILNVSIPMNTNMTGLDGFKKPCILVLWTKAALGLEKKLFVSCNGPKKK